MRGWMERWKAPATDVLAFFSTMYLSTAVFLALFELLICDLLFFGDYVEFLQPGRPKRGFRIGACLLLVSYAHRFLQSADLGKLRTIFKLLV